MQINGLKLRMYPDNIVDIAMSDFGHSITANGVIYVAGDNEWGALGLGKNVENRPSPLGLFDVLLRVLPFGIDLLTFQYSEISVSIKYIHAVY